MLAVLVTLTILLTAADHWTTYLCLSTPVDGWEVTEANPIADWLFQSMGLLPGIVLDSVVTLLAIAFLIVTPLVPQPLKTGFFALVVVWTGWAVTNNLSALRALGLSPLGLA